MKKVTIYCSASNKIDPKYNAAARELVRALHALGYGVVSGGGKRGTMGAITAESVRVLGYHVAVLPRFMDGQENPDVSRVIWTDTMSTLEGYYNPLKALLDHYVSCGMMEPEDRSLMLFPETVEELITLLK